MHLVFILISILFLGLIWGLLGGYLYRKPWLIAVLGILVGVIGSYMSSVFLEYEKIPELIRLFPDIMNGKDAVSVLISSISGSLFASAIILQAQNIHNRDVADANKEIELARDLFELFKKNDNHLKKTAKNISTEEFWVQYNIIRAQEFRAITKILNAEEKRNKLQP